MKRKINEQEYLNESLMSFLDKWTLRKAHISLFMWVLKGIIISSLIIFAIKGALGMLPAENRYVRAAQYAVTAIDDKQTPKELQHNLETFQEIAQSENDEIGAEINKEMMNNPNASYNFSKGDVSSKALNWTSDFVRNALNYTVNKARFLARSCKGLWWKITTPELKKLIEVRDNLVKISKGMLDKAKDIAPEVKEKANKVLSEVESAAPAIKEKVEAASKAKEKINKTVDSVVDDIKNKDKE